MRHLVQGKRRGPHWRTTSRSYTRCGLCLWPRARGVLADRGSHLIHSKTTGVLAGAEYLFVFFFQTTFQGAVIAGRFYHRHRARFTRAIATAWSDFFFPFLFAASCIFIAPSECPNGLATLPTDIAAHPLFFLRERERKKGKTLLHHGGSAHSGSRQRPILGTARTLGPNNDKEDPLFVCHAFSLSATQERKKEKKEKKEFIVPHGGPDRVETPIARWGPVQWALLLGAACRIEPNRRPLGGTPRG